MQLKRNWTNNEHVDNEMIDILFSESAGGSLKAGQKKLQKSIFVFELALDIGDISNDDFA